MTEPSFDERARLARLFVKTLSTAAMHRNERGVVVDGPDGSPEIGWVLFEREQMTALVDAERAQRGLEPVGPEYVRAVESSATGHCDYSSKFSFGCAEVVLGIGPWAQIVAQNHTRSAHP